MRVFISYRHVLVMLGKVTLHALCEIDIGVILLCQMSRAHELFVNRFEKNHDLKKKKKNRFFYLNRIFLIYLIFYLFDFFFKSGTHNVIKYFTIRLSGVNTATQVCALCAYVLKNTQNFVDLDACKQLFVLNSYKSAIKKPEVKKIKKNHKSMIFLERFIS